MEFGLEWAIELLRGIDGRVPVYEDGTVTLQRDLDAARIGHRLSPTEEREFRARIDSFAGIPGG